MSGDFYKEWRIHSEVDYFPQLVLLWLSTNAWYRSHYSEISGKRDRDFLAKLRDDHTSRNKLYTRFNKLLQAEGTKGRVELLNHIEGLFFALNTASLLWDDEPSKGAITFENCLLTHNPKSYGNLIVKPRASGIRVSETLKVTDNKTILFNGLLEIIYKVRCLLVHGEMGPSEESHDVVKHCYFLLRELMDF
jgi:hypothetical protein